MKERKKKKGMSCLSSSLTGGGRSLLWPSSEGLPWGLPDHGSRGWNWRSETLAELRPLRAGKASKPGPAGGGELLARASPQTDEVQEGRPLASALQAAGTGQGSRPERGPASSAVLHSLPGLWPSASVALGTSAAWQARVS